MFTVTSAEAEPSSGESAHAATTASEGEAKEDSASSEQIEDIEKERARAAHRALHHEQIDARVTAQQAAAAKQREAVSKLAIGELEVGSYVFIDGHFCGLLF